MQDITSIDRFTNRETQILNGLLHRWEPKKESFDEFCNKIFNNQPDRLSPETRKGSDSQIRDHK